MSTIQLPEVPKGWDYAGILLTPLNGVYVPSSHLILSQEEKDGLTWSHANEWAADHGGELFDQREAALCYANLRPLFEHGLYWTRNQFSATSAWVQGFANGSQDIHPKHWKFSGRVVHRLPLIIQELTA